MYAAFYLLTFVGLVGSYDVLYYHIYKLRLFRQHEAMWENLTHCVRALLFAVMLLTVLHVRASGWWWLVYPILLSFELTNTLCDVIMEPHTRRNLGGLPPVEYVLHVVLSLLTGAALASVIWGTYELLSEPTGLALGSLQVSNMVLLGAYWSIVIAVGMFLFEFFNFLRLFRRRGQRATEKAPATGAGVGIRSAKESVAR